MYMHKDSERQHQYDITYIKMALTWAELSKARRKKVGALIVKGTTIISDGYNGTPSGFENECEIPTFDENNNFVDYETKWYVLHAESNAIAKVARSTQSCEGSTLYITYSPCRECSKLILQSGITRVVYLEEYRDRQGLELLAKAGIDLKKIDLP
jgi:dCMP deaminase